MKKMSSFFKGKWPKPSKKYSFFFNDGWAEERELLGMKGANLCEMFRLGLPVPHGFILSTEACRDYLIQDHDDLSSDLAEEIERAVKNLEQQTGKSFGSITRSEGSPDQALPPLLLSIRATPPRPVQGLAETVLNLGLNSLLVHTLAKEWGNSRWVYDTFARFLVMFGTAVLHIDLARYEEVYEVFRKSSNVEHNSDLSADDLREVIQRFRSFTDLPEDPWVQLRMTVKAVFDSWRSPIATHFRDLHNVPLTDAVAVVVQSMVYGNFNELSGAGMAYTRNPNTGLKELYGEYLTNAAGEDVLHGIRTPLKLEQLYATQPLVYDKLINIEYLLENHYRDMQVVEFTVENGNLFILETRSGRRSAFAAVRIANDMVREKLITEREALLHLNAHQLTHFLFPTLDPHYVDSFALQLLEKIICRGKGLGYGAMSGKVVFTLDDAVQEQSDGNDAVLCLNSDGLQARDMVKLVRGLLLNSDENQGVLKAACEGLGKTAVIGAQDIIIDAKAQELRTKDNKMVISRGDVITIDGSTGLVYVGEMPTITPIHDEEFQTILHWADKYKRMQVLANADTAEDVKRALELGAEGVGLCRTEHMFFQADRINLFRQLLLTESEEARKHCLQSILPLQQQDFLEIFRAAEHQEVVIRLFSEPMSSFFPALSSPDFDKELDYLSVACSLSKETCRSKLECLRDHDVFMGCKGARLFIVNSIFLELQARAIFGALISELTDNQRPNPDITIMVPFVFSETELELCLNLVNRVWSELWDKEVLSLQELPFKIGVVLEVPRAFLVADKISAVEGLNLVSFASTELTELMFGMDKADSGTFMAKYLEKNLLVKDPFSSLDAHGVCNLLRYAKRKIKVEKDKLKLMISGDSGFDGKSFEFLEKEDIDAITCQSFQVPKAKVLAAQAHIHRMTEFQARVRFHPPMI